MEAFCTRKSEYIGTVFWAKGDHPFPKSSTTKKILVENCKKILSNFKNFSPAAPIGTAGTNFSFKFGDSGQKFMQ